MKIYKKQKFKRPGTSLQNTHHDIATSSWPKIIIRDVLRVYFWIEESSRINLETRFAPVDYLPRTK